MVYAFIPDNLQLFEAGVIQFFHLGMYAPYCPSDVRLLEFRYNAPFNVLTAVCLFSHVHMLTKATSCKY